MMIQQAAACHLCKCNSPHVPQSMQGALAGVQKVRVRAQRLSSMSTSAVGAACIRGYFVHALRLFQLAKPMKARQGLNRVQSGLFQPIGPARGRQGLNTVQSELLFQLTGLSLARQGLKRVQSDMCQLTGRFTARQGLHRVQSGLFQLTGYCTARQGLH